MSVAAILSMLHEPPASRDSASRLFRGEPVLSWTLARLAKSHCIAAAAVICWEDQRDAVKPLADEAGACLLVKGPRGSLPSIDATSAALRWSDGWRGGLLGACHFDRGFYAPYIAEALDQIERASASQQDRHVLLVDPSAGLVDPQLVEALVDHGQKGPGQDLVFTQAAPGLCGVLLRDSFIRRLVLSKTHPGRLLSYWPDLAGRDPITTDACLAVHPSLARTLLRFTLDSERQIRRLTSATADLNGQLMSADAHRLVAILGNTPMVDPLPRDLVLEINTSRATRPVFWPGTHLDIQRPDMSRDMAFQILDQLAAADDARVTLGGVGDPLLAEHVTQIVERARDNQLAVHIETDLAGISAECLEWLGSSGIDVLSVCLPAATRATYQRMMGADRFDEVMNNLAALARRRQRPPILAPTFVKCGENLDEMEPWYEHFLRTCDAAVINGPSDYGAQIPDHACADMSPPRRRPCQRLDSRMTIHCDGIVPSCEQDVLGRQVIGSIDQNTLEDLWKQKMIPIRSGQATQNLAAYSLCANCREWHRP